MCGFAGVVAWEERFRVTRETLARMSARIAHRGPDGEGLHLNHDDAIGPDRPQLGLVHRRLAILDPDPRANQPFMDRHGRWIVFNGEIYNFRDLRADLSKRRPEYPWRTSGDTEVLLVAYDVWGEECVEHLNGMFAFAVWDEPRQQLFLARDRMGQKPLYYSGDERSGGVAFASELGAIKPVEWVDQQMSRSSLMFYLRWGHAESTSTIYDRVHQLPPASTLTWTCLGARPVRTYFNANATASPELASDAAAPAITRRLVTQAVRRQLVSDVPLGCFLSGGVDSAIIAAAMKQSVPSDQPVLTFSMGFDDPRYDETIHASRVAEHLGTKHHRFEVRPNTAEALPALAAAFGEPFADSSALPGYYLARETRSHVKVSLSGDGGDELFGGYDRYRALAFSERLTRTTALTRLASASVWQAVPGSHPKSRSARLKRFLASLRLPVEQRYERYMELFSSTLARELLDEPVDPSSGYLAAGLGEFLRNRPLVPAALALDRVTYLPDDLLVKVDRASMLHALEVRSPFMDHELVGFAAGLTTDQLLRGGPKRMLREAFAADLPAWVFKRRKMGFAVPIGEWFRGELRPMLRDHLFAADSFATTHFRLATVQRLVDEHERQTIDHSQRLYALLMLELWWCTTRT